MKLSSKSDLSSDNPKVSVIIATFNCAGTLQRCIDSILEQDYRETEIIVMDGQSTDATTEIIKANSDAISYWESKPDRGIYHAWNKALDYAEGKWICFLGADDYFAAKHSISTMISVADNSIDYIFGRIAVIDDTGRIQRVCGERWNWSRMKRYQTVVHTGTLHNRALFTKYGKFHDKYVIAGDYEFLLRAGREVSTAYVDEVIVHSLNMGVSRIQYSLLFKEVREIQAAHTEIGPYRALVNYSTAVSKNLVKRLLRCNY